MMVFKRAFILAAALAALPLAVDPRLGLVAPDALGQQIGNDAWNYSRGTRGFWANYQAVRKAQDGTGGGVGSGGSGGEVYIYQTTSTAIANQVIQQVGDNSTGIFDGQIGQGSSGNQTAKATAEATNNPTNTILSYPAAQ